MLESLFLEIWVMDFEFGLAGADYFKGLVKDGSLTPAGYKKVTGEDYVAEQTQPTQPAQA
ncbi:MULTISPECIES: hypothetical protein [Lactobacillus]|uniref:XkdX family protein n=1 Tax=Lactobacillus xujianguonis TaxID=2495899 RepID=A0A437SSW1_9LACO|nr:MULTISPECIES: hypothetical protein [Lactobacillus]RVU69985.1 hypothetical protein EJK17_10065 [Lactobacillus xujianguonis]RVU72353.1 hypothetical protein EJK20_10330 [Lactobacillus xujianguonis]